MVQKFTELHRTTSGRFMLKRYSEGDSNWVEASDVEGAWQATFIRSGRSYDVSLRGAHVRAE